jgi:sulfur carrier protein
MNEASPQGGPFITIVVNGQEWSVKSDCTISAFLQDLAVAPARVVVQLDGVIIPRADFAQARLREGCHLEIVTLVGGG